MNKQTSTQTNKASTSSFLIKPIQSHQVGREGKIQAGFYLPKEEIARKGEHFGLGFIAGGHLIVQLTIQC